MKNIWVLLSICSLISFGISSNQLANAANDVIVCSQKATNLSVDDFRKFKKGMLRQDFLEKIGQPGKKIEKDIHIYIYSLADGTEMRVGFDHADKLSFIDHTETILE